jgi:nitrile hydratase
MTGQHSDSEVAVRVRRLEERLIDAGLTSDDQLDGIIGQLGAGSPTNGARVVARAWSDPAFAERLLSDANRALDELGLSMSTGPQVQRLTVVANTPATHTCWSARSARATRSACSGRRRPGTRARPTGRGSFGSPGRAAEFGLVLPEATEIVVHDTSAESRHMVVPMRPADTGGLTEAELAAQVTRED